MYGVVTFLIAARLAISQVTQSELTELTAKAQFSQSVLKVAGLTELTDVGLTLAVSKAEFCSRDSHI